MNFDWKVNDLSFDGALKELEEAYKIIYEVGIHNKTGKDCTINIYVDYNCSTYPTTIFIFYEAIRIIFKNLPDINFSFPKVETTSYHYYIGLYSLLPVFQNIKLNSREGLTNVPVSRIDREKIEELCKNQGVTIGEATNQIVQPYAKVIASENVNFVEPFTYILREMIRNSFEHSETSIVYVCIQNWKNRDQIEIAIADTGIGVYNSLVSNMNYKDLLRSDLDALKLAIHPGITRDFTKSKKEFNSYWENSGYGLFYASQLAKKLDGSFMVASGKSRLHTSNNSNDIYSSFDYSGTIVRLIFKPSMLVNFKEVLSEISELGKQITTYQEISYNKPSEASRI